MGEAERLVRPITRGRWEEERRSGSRPERPPPQSARYFFLWRIRFRSFLYLCFRIFLRRFLTTLLTPVSLPLPASHRPPRGSGYFRDWAAFATAA